MVPETEPEFYLKEAKDMLNITQRLIADGKFVGINKIGIITSQYSITVVSFYVPGYRFTNFEIITIQLEPGLW